MRRNTAHERKLPSRTSFWCPFGQGEDPPIPIHCWGVAMGLYAGETRHNIRHVVHEPVLHMPKRKHLKALEAILEYLKKYPKLGIVINPSKPIYHKKEYKAVTMTEDFGHQYGYFRKEIDPNFPNQK